MALFIANLSEEKIKSCCEDLILANKNDALNSIFSELAISDSNVKTMEFLLEKDNLITVNTCNSAFANACIRGCLEITKLLLGDSRTDPNTNDSYPLRCAIDCEHLKIVELLLTDSRINHKPRNGYMGSITRAVSFNKFEILKLLLESDKIDPTEDNNQPLKFACGKDDSKFVELLLKNDKIDPSIENNRPLRIACENGNAEIVKLLLSDARVNSQDKRSAMISAYNYNKHEIIKLLIPHVDTTKILHEGLLNLIKQFEAEKIKEDQYRKMDDLQTELKNGAEKLDLMTTKCNEQAHKITELLSVIEDSEKKLELMRADLKTIRENNIKNNLTPKELIEICKIQNITKLNAVEGTYSKKIDF